MDKKNKNEKLKVGSEQLITSYGGIVPILKKMKECNLPGVIHSCLGKRVNQAKYSYEDAIIAWILTSLCGGTRLDHITGIKDRLAIFPDLNLPSNDTLGRVMKQLATDMATQRNITHHKNAAISYTHYNNNGRMNKMLVKATKAMGTLREGCLYTLHIDATFLETNSAGAVMSNEKAKNGYNPMVCLIDNMPVFISMRNGNGAASFQIKECLEQCLDILAQNKIRVGRVISDGAGYNRALTDMLQERGIKFNIHTPVNPNFKGMLKQIDECKEWKKVELETGHSFRTCEVADIPYTMTGSENQFRLIVARVFNKSEKVFNEGAEEKTRREMIEKKMVDLGNRKLLKGENKTYTLGKWKKYKGYKLKLIITNDFNKSAQNLLLEYNKRGNAERQFDAMKNNFAWRLPPFSSMTANTVFLIVAALANNVFRAVLMKFKNKIPQLKRTLRFPEFKKRFIDVICSFINKEFKFHHTKIDYHLIM